MSEPYLYKAVITHSFCLLRMGTTQLNAIVGGVSFNEGSRKKVLQKFPDNGIEEISFFQWNYSG